MIHGSNEGRSARVFSPMELGSGPGHASVEPKVLQTKMRKEGVSVALVLSENVGSS